MFFCTDPLAALSSFGTFHLTSLRWTWLVFILVLLLDLCFLLFLSVSLSLVLSFMPSVLWALKGRNLRSDGADPGKSVPGR